MREIVLDTETTGMDFAGADRIVEIGCVELIDWLPTGRTFHCYLNPERDMPPEAERVHGLSAAFLADKPRFADIADDLLAFLGDATLVIHNAAFDMGFLNAELARAGRPILPMDRAFDTVTLARQKFPGQRASLDELCKRFGIDLSVRTKHGALLDSELLAQVYLELRGGRQTGFALVETAEVGVVASLDLGLRGSQGPRAARPHAPTADEATAHAAFIAKIKNALWARADAEKNTA